MPTPYGSRGGMAFGADELRVLRRALAVALHPAPLPDEDVQACLRLAESVDEAVREAGRLRAFLLADLARYRAALPGSVTGYLELLQDALATGYPPGRRRPGRAACPARERRWRPSARPLRAPRRRSGAPYGCVRPGRAPPGLAPAPRTRLFALPGGRAAGDAPAGGRRLRRGRRSRRSPSRSSPRRPSAPLRAGRCPSRPRCFPPRRRPEAPAGEAGGRLASLGGMTTYPRLCPPW